MVFGYFGDLPEPALQAVPNPRGRASRASLVRQDLQDRRWSRDWEVGHRTSKDRWRKAQEPGGLTYHNKSSEKNQLLHVYDLIIQPSQTWMVKALQALGVKHVEISIV